MYLQLLLEHKKNQSTSPPPGDIYPNMVRPFLDTMTIPGIKVGVLQNAEHAISFDEVRLCHWDFH